MNISCPERFRPTSLRANNAPPARIGIDGRRQNSRHRQQRTIERKLTKCDKVIHLILRQHLHRDQHGQCNRQIEMTALFNQIGGRKIDDDFFRR